jgi:glycosyltransferase involved in cell wall biosynthesis
VLFLRSVISFNFQLPRPLGFSYRIPVGPPLAAPMTFKPSPRRQVDRSDVSPADRMNGLGPVVDQAERSEPATLAVAMVDPFAYTLPYDNALCRALATSGHDVTLFASRQTSGAVAAGVSWEPSGFVHPTTSTRFHRASWRVGHTIVSMLYLPAWFRLLRRLRRLRPDVIHLQWLPYPLVDATMLRLLARIAPVVLTAHDATPRNGQSGRLEMAAWRQALSLVDAIVVHTRAGERLLATLGADSQQVALIPHGQLELAPEPVRVDRAPGSPLSFLQFGYMQDYKGIDVLVRAVGLMDPEIRARCRFVIAGAALMDITGVQHLIQETGVADVVDLVPRYFSDAEVSSLLRGADVLVFPYRRIQSSGVLSLALNLQRPVVATAVGCFKEMIEPGTHGLLIPPDDPVALAAALTRVATDDELRQTLAANLAAVARKIPSWDLIASSTVDVYRDVIQRRRSAR